MGNNLTGYKSMGFGNIRGETRLEIGKLFLK